ncbi:MAG: HAD family hydrolase [Treponema sp.]|jgi:phosphoglycolate phosphatase/putative hydrolase of the HAD superfamily|nr:HAD family hydrolase [Treponema sp.]
MKIFRLPKKITALIFDMDLTLYSHAEYGQIQIDNLIAIAAEKRGLSLAETNREIEAARLSWAASHNGNRPSLSNIILSWGFTMEENVSWRERAYEPEKFLKRDEKLKACLLALSYSLGIVTNNPLSIAKRTLACLGIEDCFDALACLDTLMIAKPHRLPFEKVVELLNNCSLNDSSMNASPEIQHTPESCVSIGDRYEIDLELPLEMGMGAILVDGVEDVYTLPEVLRRNYE